MGGGLGQTHPRRALRGAAGQAVRGAARFYDAIAARAEEAIAYLNGLDLDALPEDAARLLQLLHSMILVSYAVNVFFQPRIPDSGAAFFDMVVEPAV